MTRSLILLTALLVAGCNMPRDPRLPSRAQERIDALRVVCRDHTQYLASDDNWALLTPRYINGVVSTC